LYAPDPFLVLPFGHGPRGCIGRKLAEDSLLMLLIHLFAKFRLQWNGVKLDCVSELINRPDSDLMFLIEEWDEDDLQ